MELLGDTGHMKSRFSFVMVCAKRTTGIETVLDAPMVLLGDEAHVHARFGPFRDSTSLDAR